MSLSIRVFALSASLLISLLLTAQEVDSFVLARQDFKNTSNNSVTITTYKKDGISYVYQGGQSSDIDVYSIDQKGILNPVSHHKLSNDNGPVRGLIGDNIGGTDFLFAGNKGASKVEVFKILDDGSLSKVFILDDTDETYLGTVITLQVVHMKKSSYLFVGGLEKVPGLSCFKIHNDGSLTHIQSMQDNDELHTDGIIGMVVHKIQGKTYLYTGGFHDSGVSGFRVFESGRFRNINNISDNKTDRYLTGTYPVTGITLGGQHYVVVGHRHYKYYKRGGNWIKVKDWVYHGDGVTVFRINNKGALELHSTLVDDENTMISGQTRIEILRVDENQAFVAIATKDDESIQLCKLDEKGILTPLSYIKTGYPIYYGMGATKIEDDYFFIASSTDPVQKKIVSYKVSAADPKSKGKVLRHVVNLKFKDNIAQDKINEALATFVNLKGDIPEIAAVEGGLNNSTEGHSKGFDYCFTLTFKDTDAREIYLFHKAHIELVESVGPLLEDVMVMDYWAEN
ncbi:MAG: Dabb family protein [Bacteroidota bacterium]